MKFKRLFILVFIIVISCAGCDKTEKQSTTQGLTDVADEFSQMLSYFIETDSYDYDEEKIESWGNVESILAEYDKDEDGKSNFVRACFLLYEGNADEATNKFEEIIDQTSTSISK